MRWGHRPPPPPPPSDGAKFAWKHLLFVLPQGSAQHPCRVSTSLVLSLDLAGCGRAASAARSHRRVQCHRAAELQGLGPGAVLSTGLPSVPGASENRRAAGGRGFLVSPGNASSSPHPRERGSNQLALFDVGDEL